MCFNDLGAKVAIYIAVCEIVFLKKFKKNPLLLNNIIAKAISRGRIAYSAGYFPGAMIPFIMA